jgi:cyclase
MYSGLTGYRIRTGALACLALSSAAVRSWSTPSVALEPVAPGVYAALQPFADRFNDSNSTIIVLDDSVMVVDTQTTLTATRGVIEQIRKLTNKPVRWVINTHWHGDHVQGNQLYREAFPSVQFIAHVNTRLDMAQRTTSELRDQVASLPGQIEKYRQTLASGQASNGERLTEDQKSLLEMRVDTFSKQLPDLRQTHVVLPDVTFDNSLSLYSGSQEVRLIHFGGHTLGDVVVYLPAEKVLITGDLVDDMPYTGDGSPADLVETLHQLDRLDFDLIVPGHGGIERGREHLHRITSMFESIVSQVQDAVRNGLTLDATKHKVDLEEFRESVTHGEEHATRAFNGFVPIAIERAYAEAKESVRRDRK